MQEQNYVNHRQFVPAYHAVLSGILLLTLIGSLVNLYKSWGDHERLYSAALIVVLVITSVMIALFCRIFSLKAQDRAIRAEENLRHYVLTGKLLDPRLGIRQIIALRFASDAEFAALAARAAQESLSEDAIKRAVEHWRADTYRV
ncbi:MAG: DUF6526 family protein [Bryobacteraceae bacterium]